MACSARRAARAASGRPDAGRRHRAGAGASVLVTIRLLSERALAQPELDLEAESEGIERVRLGVVEEHEAQIIARAARRSRIASSRRSRAAPADRPCRRRARPVARPADDRKQDRRGLVPDFGVFGPDEIDPARAPGRSSAPKLSISALSPSSLVRRIVSFMSARIARRAGWGKIWFDLSFATAATRALSGAFAREALWRRR